MALHKTTLKVPNDLWWVLTPRWGKMCHPKLWAKLQGRLFAGALRLGRIK